METLNMLDKIALRRLRCWIHHPKQQDLFQTKVITFELGQLGYKINNIEKFTSITRKDFASALSILQQMRGDDVQYVPLFTNFPDDLPNDGEYLIRRVLGFFGLNTFDSSKFGADPISQMQREDLWKNAVAAQARRLSDTHTEWIILTLVEPNEAEQRLTKWVSDLLYGATPIQEALWDDIFTVLEQLNIDIKTDNIQIKETLARLAANQWQKWNKLCIKTPTDMLRMFAFMRGQDVSLGQPIDLKGLKFSKPQRREIITFLNNCSSLAEDLLRYKRLWISISKWLHPGDFVKQFPTVTKVFDDLRNNRIQSFESLVFNSTTESRIEHLLQRPSVLLRKLTWLLKDYSPEVVAQTVLKLKDKVTSLPIPLLVTAYCAVKYDGERVVINKKGKPYTIEQREPLGNVSPVLEAIDVLILTKLRDRKNWDKVWIDPAIDKLVLPLQARKQSDGLLNLGRGSRIAFNAEVIRLFIYWHEKSCRTDIDLSAMKLDEKFQFAGHVSWNNYDSGEDIAHSGDIQSAPMGAAEFIDLRLAALKNDYIVPAVIHYCGERYSSLKACYAGWMNRSEVGSHRQTFDAKTVAQKVNVNQDSETWIPFILDVTNKEIIYVDLYSNGSRVIEGNDSFPFLASALAAYTQAKPTFGMLARWYARANNAILVDKKDANIIIGVSDDCTVNVLKLVGQGVTSF